MTRELNKVDDLNAGGGYLKIGGIVTPEKAAGFVDYSHRLKPNLSLFARGEAGACYKEGVWRRSVSAIGGLRWRL